MKKHRQRIAASYRLECRYPGQSEALDRTLARIIGRNPDAVGYDYVTRERNLNWIFQDYEKAASTEERLLSELRHPIRCQNLPDVRKIDCQIKPVGVRVEKQNAYV